MIKHRSSDNGWWLSYNSDHHHQDKNKSSLKMQHCASSSALRLSLAACGHAGHALTQLALLHFTVQVVEAARWNRRDGKADIQKNDLTKKNKDFMGFSQQTK